METTKLDILSVTSTQAVQGLQLSDSNGQESVEGGFLGLFSSLQTASHEAENQVAEIAIDAEIGKPLPEDGEPLPDFNQVNVLEVAESNAIRITREPALSVITDEPVLPVITDESALSVIVDEPALSVSELPVAVGDKPDIVTPVLVNNTADKQVVAPEVLVPKKGGRLPVFSSAIPLEKPVDESVVATATKSTTLAATHLPEITTRYLKEGQGLAVKKELPAVKNSSQLSHSNIATQIIEGDLDPRVLETIDRQSLKPEMDAAVAEAPVIAEKKVEPFQALRMANVKVAAEPGVFSESLASNIGNIETRAASGTGSLLRSEPAIFSLEPQAPLTLSLRQANWDQSLSNNVLWMVKEDIQTATIRVKPAELGPLNIQISVQQDQLNINISANQAVTREALEAALPKLREQFASQGFSQINVDISDQGQPQSGQEGLAEQGDKETPVFSSVAETNHDQEENISQSSSPLHNSLLDTFA